MAVSRAIPHFQRFLSIFLDLSTSPSYHPYQWLYPGSYQPLQPTAVLLVDLWEHPLSAEATVSRKLLDRTFTFLGPNGRLSNGMSMEDVGWQQGTPPFGGGQAGVGGARKAALEGVAGGWI